MQFSFLSTANLLNKIIHYYVILIGWENVSWGYHGDDGNFFYSDKLEPYGPVFTADDTIGCCLNFTNNTVFYTKNGVHLGNYYT